MIRLLTITVCLLALYCMESHAQDAEETKQAYCWSYIGKMKRLYTNIKSIGLEQMIAQHPPQAEGVSLEFALKIGAEIEADESPSAWLKAKWDSCIANPQDAAK